MAIEGASLTPIYNRLNSVGGYHPMNVDSFADWSVEAGDIVSVSRDGTAYASPVHSTRLVWRGSPEMQINATGKEKRDNIAKVSRRKYGRGGAGMRNNQGLYYEMFSEDGHLHSSLEFTESRLHTEFEDADAQLRSEFEITASHLRTEFEDADAQLQSEFEVTASRMRTEYSDGIAGVHSEVVQTASSWGAKISGVVDENGNVTAASIAVAINASTGESEARIDAQKVYIGNTKSTTVIAGKATLSDVTADYIQSQIASLTRLTMLSGYAGSFYVNNANGQSQNIDAAIWDIQLVPSGNTYTLKRKRIGDSDYVDIGSFSRATALSGAWSSGTLTVSASPQGNTFTRTIRQDTAGETWGTGYVVVPIYAEYTSGGTTYTESTGRNVYVFFDDTKLQNKTVTANGVITADEGYLGLKEVTVQVPSSTTVPVISYAWSQSGQLTVSTTPAAQEDLVRRFHKGTESWSGNVVTVPIIATWGSQDQYSENTNIPVTVDASARYTAGQNSVTVSKSYDRTNSRVVFSKSAGTASTKAVMIGVAGSWNENIYTYNIKDYEDNPEGVNIENNARTVDATARYTAGESAGKAAVTLNNPTWQYNATQAESHITNTVTVSTSGRPTQLSKSIPVTIAQGTWNGNTKTVDITTTNGVLVARDTVDATVRYTAGETAGKSAVTLNNPSWQYNATQAESKTTNTVTVSTSGRPTQLSKEVPVTLTQGSWSGNTKTVDITTTNGALVARTTVDASTLVTNAGYAGRAAVGLADPTWNSQTTPTASRTVTVSTTGRTNSSGTTDNLSKSKTVHLTVGSWSSGSIPIYIRDGSTSGTIVAQNSVSMPSVTDTSWVNTTGRTWRADITIGGVTRSSETKDFDGYYTDGYNAGVVYEKGIVRVAFGQYQGAYYANAYENISGAPSIPNATIEYKLQTYGSGANTKVIVVNQNGTQYQNTPVLDVGNLYTEGQNAGYSSGYSAGVTYEKGIVRVRFGQYQGSYYATAYENVSGAPSIANASVTYKLQTYGSGTDTKVIVVNASGTQYQDTPVLDVGSLYTDGYNAGNSAGYSSGVAYEKGIVRVRFGQYQGSYYATAYENISGAPSIANASVTYKLQTYGSGSSTKVIVVNASGTQYQDTPVLDIGSLYTDGQNAVTLNNPSWQYNTTQAASRSTNTVTVSTNGRPTQLSKDIPVTLTVGAWSNNIKTVDITTTNGALVARTTVDASGIYTNGYNAGVAYEKDIVRVRFGKNTSSGVTTYYVNAYEDVTGTPAITTSTVVYNLRTYDSGANTKVIVVDENGTQFQNAQVLEIGDVYTGGYNAGRTAVTVGEPTWSAQPSTGVPTSRTLTMKTSGRGTEATRDLAFFLTENDWNASNQKTVFMRTVSTSGTVYAQRTVDATSVYNAGVDYERSIVRTRFGQYQGTYYANAYENITGSPSINNSTSVYSLRTYGSGASTVVIMVNGSGTQYQDTPVLDVGYLYTEGYNAGSGSGYSKSATLYCSSITTDSSGYHVTLTVQYGLSQSVPFTQGSSKTVHFN